MRAWREWLAAGLSLLAATVGAQAADALAVDVINESEPTLCAEKDNVYLKLPGIRASYAEVPGADRSAHAGVR